MAPSSWTYWAKWIYDEPLREARATLDEWEKPLLEELDRMMDEGFESAAVEHLIANGIEPDGGIVAEMKSRLKDNLRSVESDFSGTRIDRDARSIDLSSEWTQEEIDAVERALNRHYHKVLEHLGYGPYNPTDE